MKAIDPTKTIATIKAAIATLLTETSPLCDESDNQLFDFMINISLQMVSSWYGTRWISIS